MPGSMSTAEERVVDLEDEGDTFRDAVRLATSPQSIGKRLRLTRVVYGLTQTDLVPIVGASKSTISNWERNDSTSDPINVTQVMALADLYGQNESDSWKAGWVLWVLGLRDTPPLLRGFATSLLPEGA